MSVRIIIKGGLGGKNVSNFIRPSGCCKTRMFRICTCIRIDNPGQLNNSGLLAKNIIEHCAVSASDQSRWIAVSRGFR